MVDFQKSVMLILFNTVDDPSIVKHPTDVYAVAPFSGVFTCSVQGYGHLNVLWYKSIALFQVDSRPEKSTVSIRRLPEITITTLVIPNVTDEDAGEYVCVVVFDMKALWSNIVSLRVSGTLYICSYTTV